MTTDQRVSDAKHTPGPWEAVNDLVVTPPRAEIHAAIQEGRRVTSRRICSTENETYIGRSECEANARLISAAPDLLQALGDLLDAVQIADPGVYDLSAARAAIAKATGATP